MNSDESDKSVSQRYKKEEDCLIQLGIWMYSRENNYNIFTLTQRPLKVKLKS